MVIDQLKNQPRLVTAIGLVLGLTAILTTVLITRQTNQNDLVIIYGSGSREIVVDVRGAVARPGVYVLQDGQRVTDALAAAGGADPDADLTSVNLARRLDDGELLTIPAVGAATPIVAAAEQTPVGSVTGQGISYRINVNTASQAELESLPGIGPVIAQRIIDLRVANGPFRSTSDLLAVEGISENLLVEIQPLITLGS